MNKAMIASMREQLRPSEAARTALLERVGEIPNKQEGNSVRKYFAVAACAALLLCAYPAYNVLKSQNPPKLHSYITVEAGDKIITLSTCVNKNVDRLVVQAKRLEN